MMNRISIILYTFVLAFCVSSCAPDLEPQDQDGHWAPNENKIVYVCYKKQRVETGEFFSFTPFGPYDGIKGFILKEICITDARGTYRTLITNDQSEDFDPNWSPDGEKIVFASRHPQSNENRLFIVDVDGTDLRCLIISQEISFHSPKWSPDGGIIAFVEGVSGNLYTIKPDGTGLTRQTTIGRIGSFDWSPNGDEIVFSNLRSSNNNTIWDIYKVEVVNSQITQLTNNGIDNVQPVWSPNGDYIAYKSSGEIYLINTKNNEIIKQTNIGVVNGLIWHPNDPIIAYTIHRPLGDENDNLFLQNINGHIIQSIYLGQFEEWSIIWSSDGQYILYEKAEDLNEDSFYEKKLWVVNIETGEQWSISNNVDKFDNHMTP